MYKTLTDPKEYNMDTYKCLALSTEHITAGDIAALEAADNNMVMKRDTGFFIKLYEELEYNLADIKHLSEYLRCAVTLAHNNGFRLIEFDCDVDTTGLLRLPPC